MGSFLSITNREKRRRSNRLSKPPPNKATLISISSRNPPQPVVGCTLSTPSSPAAWQDPWTGSSIPVSPSDIESTSGRSQSFPSGSAQPETLWTAVDGTGIHQLTAQNADEPWPQSPISPASRASSFNRSGSLYRRASFQPSRLVTRQPSTIQNDPRSPITDQPRRSYSAHSPPHRARSTIHHTLEEATSSNTHFRVDSQGFSLIRRRSLLTRPGVATRRSTNETGQRLSTGSHRDTIFLAKPQSTSPTIPPAPPLNHEEPAPKPSFSLPPFRPPTPTDFEYTHLGVLKLGSLRVVNGSTSPCSSDRARLHRSGSPEAAQDSQLPTEITAFTGPHNGDQKILSTQLTSVENHTACTPENVIVSMDHRPKVITNQNTPPITKPSATASVLQIPPSLEVGKHEDFPASPFSFEKSPTATTPRGMSIRESEDEGISVPDEERTLAVRLSEKASERARSYRRFSRSHRKADSGYSSAASVRSLQGSYHRTSMDSQASPQRSPGFRRFTLGGSSRDFEIYNIKPSSKFGNQLPINRHLSLQGPRTNLKYEQSGWSTSMSTMCHEPQQLQKSGRIRSSSLTIAENSSRMLSLPVYCSQLHGLGSVATEIQQFSQAEGSLVAREGSNGLGYNGRTGEATDLYPQNLIRHPQVECGLKNNPIKTTDSLNQSDSRISGGDGNINQPGALNAPRLTPENRSLEKPVTGPPNIQNPQPMVSPNAGIRPQRPINNTLSIPAPNRFGQKTEISASDRPRGRARSRSVEYQRYRSSKQQHPKLYP